MDMNAIPISKGVVAAALVWAGTSAFVLGPLVSAREIERSNWREACMGSLATEIDARRPVQSTVPEFGCRDIGDVMDGLMGSGIGQSLCTDVIDGVINHTLDLARKIDPGLQARDAARALADQQLDRATELAPTRCRCASNVVASDRLRWGIYAGSGRLLGKGSDSLTSDLTQALYRPACAIAPKG